MASADQVVDWIEKNVDSEMTPWQKQVIRSIFDEHSRTIVVHPRRQGMTAFLKSVDDAMIALATR